MTESLLKARVQDVKTLTSDLKILYLQPEKPLLFDAGQYITLIQEGFEERSYSIASAPSSDVNIIELHIRRRGHLSAYLYDKVSVGSSLKFKGPHGVCTYTDQCKKPMLALAGGIGLAQIKSIVDHALSTDRETPLYLYHGTKQAEDFYLNTYFKTLEKEDPRLIYRPILSDQTVDDSPDQTATRYAFLQDYIEQDFKSLKGFCAYLCGTPDMVKILETCLVKKGIDTDYIYADKWEITK